MEYRTNEARKTIDKPHNFVKLVQTKYCPNKICGQNQFASKHTGRFLFVIVRPAHTHQKLGERQSASFTQS